MLQAKYTVTSIKRAEIRVDYDRFMQGYEVTVTANQKYDPIGGPHMGPRHLFLTGDQPMIGDHITIMMDITPMNDWFTLAKAGEKS